jgi:hypothetical protein
VGEQRVELSEDDLRALDPQEMDELMVFDMKVLSSPQDPVESAASISQSSLFLYETRSGDFGKTLIGAQALRQFSWALDLGNTTFSFQ